LGKTCPKALKGASLAEKVGALLGKRKKNKFDQTLRGVVLGPFNLCLGGKEGKSIRKKRERGAYSWRKKSGA